MGESLVQPPVEQERPDAMSLLITSGKGGTGKTAVAVNLGAAFALLGRRVVVVEACVGNRHADAMMGLENRVVNDLVDVTGGLVSFQQALIKDRRIDRLYLLAGAQTRSLSEIDPAAFHGLLEQLKQEFDLVLIDAPAEFVRANGPTLQAVDRVVLVATPEICSVRGCHGLLYYVEKLRRDTLLLVNQYDPALARRGVLPELADVREMLPQPLIGVIQKDDYEFLTGLSRGEPVVYNPHSPVTVAFEQVARRLLGETVPLTVPEPARSIESRAETHPKEDAIPMHEHEESMAPTTQAERVDALLAEVRQEVERTVAELRQEADRTAAELRQEAAMTAAELAEQLEAKAALEHRLQAAEGALVSIREALFQLDTRRAVELLAAYGLKAPQSSPAA